MGLNDTPTGERIHIGFFGCTNSGKSSLVNAVTGQFLSVVSDIEGTTTDPVKKTMEILPLGPVVIIDTPGIDDASILGEKRIAAAKNILHRCDIAVLVAAGKNFNHAEKGLIELFENNKIPYVIAVSKADLMTQAYADEKNIVYTSAVNHIGIENLKNALGRCIVNETKQTRFIGDLISAGDMVVLVTPIDSAAPKGRLILPQQMAVRDILDSDATAIVTKETELKHTLSSLAKPPALVITDSQVFRQVSEIVPDSVPLTSFSVLMARYKGFLDSAVEGVKMLDKLKDGARVLISEGCTHHRQCDDIGTVKLPRMLKEYTNADLLLDFSSGSGYPENLEKYDLIIHCGGCMLNDREMHYRMSAARDCGVAFTNYGTVIAYISGILKRSLSPLLDIRF